MYKLDGVGPVDNRHFTVASQLCPIGKTHPISKINVTLVPVK